MKTVKWIIATTCLLLLFGCVGSIPVGSSDHKATILYFEGGSGRIVDLTHVQADNMLINRSSYYFTSQGIKLSYLEFNFTHPSIKAQVKRTTENHFQAIQKKVNSLKENGHKIIWLMGISNGAISVMHAGACGIQDVKGLIAINPPKFTYNNYSRSGTIVDFKKIKLPILLVTHKEDHSLYKNFSNSFFKQIFPASANAEIVIFSGGRVGSSPEATHLSQLYQHGLYGLEKEFAQTVINFIDLNGNSNTAAN